MGDYPFAEGEATSDGQVTWRDGVPGEDDANRGDVVGAAEGQRPRRVLLDNAPKISPME